MMRFSVVVEGVVTLGVEAYDIHAMVRATKNHLLRDQPKSNSVLVTYGLLAREGTTARVFPTPDTSLEVNPPQFHHALLTLVNVRRRSLAIANLWAEQPMIPTRQSHANDHRRFIHCKECKGHLFYNVDRSLDYENHICAGCGTSAHTLTETGASA